jgi:soluble lytic murein transglycosylase
MRFSYLRHFVLSLAFALLPLGTAAAAGGATLATGPVQAEIFVKGKKLHDMGKCSEAERIWGAILPDAVYGPVASILIAQGRLKLGDAERAETAAREFLSKYPESPYRALARQTLLDALCAQGKPEARVMLGELISKASKDEKPALILRLAELEKKLGNYSEATDHYRRLFLDYPSSVEGLKAAEEISRMAFVGKIPPPQFTEQEQFGRAGRLVAGGRFDLAATVYEALLKDKPGDRELSLKLARCLYKNRKNQEALSLLTEIVKEPAQDKQRMDALHVLSLVYWRLDREREFRSTCSEIVERGPADLRRKALFNTGAYHLEKHRFDEAETAFKRVLKANPSPSMRADVLWKLAWIKYWKKQYKEAASAFKRASAASPLGKLATASKYWQARSLMLSGSTKDAERLLKELVENSSLDYYGFQSARLLKKLDPQPASDRGSRRPFPSVTLTPELRAVTQVATAEMLMEHHLHQFALLQLDSAPPSVRSAPAVAFLRAKAAHTAGEYRLAQELLSADLRELVEKPPENAPKEFVEIAFPRVHLSETSRAATRHSVDPYLVWAVIRQESRYDRQAVSPAGALGLMQVTPAASGLVPKGGKASAKVVAEMLDPKRNLQLGIQVLAKNLRSFNGKIVPSIASYNADIAKVRQWMRRNGNLKQDEFIESIPFAETRMYVKKVLANNHAYNRLYQKKELAGLW